MTPSEIRKLIDLAEQGKTRDIALYAHISRQHNELLNQLGALQSQNRKHCLKNTMDFSAVARWKRWNEIEVTNLHARANTVLKNKESARKVAAKSAAKVQALEYLLKKALKVELQINRRRAEQNGQPPDA